MSAVKKEALVIINLGSPLSTRTSDVRAYLQEFLMDPYVLDIPKIWRALLVYGPISLSRAKKSAEAYATVWDSQRGSPLIYQTEDFVSLLQNNLGSSIEVAMAMRYAQPSIEAVLDKVLANNPDRITLAIMYPQFAMSSTQTALIEVKRVLETRQYTGEICSIGDFYDEPEFIEAFKLQGLKHLPPSFDEKTYVLMSFHGIPERHLSRLKSFEASSCLLENGTCCDRLSEKNKNCYRAQCYQTARLLAGELGLKPEQYGVSFQSRLGRTPWIKPYTDFVLKDLAAKGVQHVYVFCPSFVTDCLETLEEIQEREAESFREAGGSSLTLVPCLNAEPEWVELFAKMYTRVRRPLSAEDLERV
jgi:protoporphyrin/coproporphyrin ferrochelatase